MTWRLPVVYRQKGIVRRVVRLRSACGPTAVNEIAVVLKQIGFMDVEAGAEYVYWSVEANDFHSASIKTMATLRGICRTK